MVQQSPIGTKAEEMWGSSKNRCRKKYRIKYMVLHNRSKFQESCINFVIIEIIVTFLFCYVSWKNTSFTLIEIKSQEN